MQNEMCNSGNNSKKKMRNILIKAHVNVYDFHNNIFPWSKKYTSSIE